MPLQFSDYRLASRAKPQATGDKVEIEARTTSYGDDQIVVVSGTTHILADEGSYVSCTNPTVSTLIAYGSGGTQTSFSDTVAFMVWKNNNSNVGQTSLRMYLHRLRLLIGGTVPAAATSTQFAIKTDSGARAPTANSTLMAPVNVNQAYGNVGGQLWVPNANTMTVPASVNARLIARGSLRQAISVTLDEYVMQFGSMDGFNSFGASGGVGRYTCDVPPVVLNPGEYAILHLWQPSATTSPLSFEFESTWWER